MLTFMYSFLYSRTSTVSRSSKIDHIYILFVAIAGQNKWYLPLIFTVKCSGCFYSSFSQFTYFFLGCPMQKAPNSFSISMYSSTYNTWNIWQCGHSKKYFHKHLDAWKLLFGAFWLNEIFPYVLVWKPEAKVQEKYRSKES